MSTIVTLLGRVECRKYQPSSNNNYDKESAGQQHQQQHQQQQQQQQQPPVHENIWTWKGAWAFGASDPPPPPDPTSSSATTPASLPFCYTFERVEDAKLTPIPSLQPTTLPNKNHDAGEGKGDNNDENNNDKKKKNNHNIDDGDDDDNDDDNNDNTVGDDNDDEKNNTAPDEDGGGKTRTEQTQSTQSIDPTNKDDEKVSVTMRDKGLSDSEKSDTKREIDTAAITTTTTTTPFQNEIQAKKPKQANDKKEESAIAPQVDSTVKGTTSKQPESKTETVEIKNSEGKSPQTSGSGATPKTGNAAIGSLKTEQEEKDLAENKPLTTDQNHEQQQQPEQQMGPTFGDDGFVDACTKYPACPPSGRWKGSFQAAIGRKGQQRSDIPEYFDVFLYAEPPADAQVQFTDPTEPLKPQHVYIRGAGENQFGIFELTGSFSLETEMLKLQRLYVRIAPEPPRRGRGRRPRRSEPGSVSRSIRKRHLSWKRKAALVEETSTRTPTVGGSQASTQSGLDDQQSRPAKRQKRKQSRDETGFLTPTTTGTVKTDGIPETVSTTTSTTVGTSRPKSPGIMSRLSSATPHGSTVVRLPVEGDFQLARWRAAHYYHYNPAPKDVTTSTTTTAATSNSNNNAMLTKSVIYEGELYNGLREGRGVCVYNNDMVYEGEWQLDKEHGYGTSWTGDKRRIIYQGEWERGRIHGQGKYYYYENSNKSSDDSHPSKIQSRYEGEFRENLRHGNGMYVLPDGSTYNGQWQNGNMTGRGTFTWPDGSVYEGDWKDNQRHGNGTLKASDGFYYEGTWVHNTMEGRGSATYPDGQEYHGMFSSGRREGRGTIKFRNGAVYEGRFRDDAVDGQGTMKIRKAVLIPRDDNGDEDDAADTEENPQPEAKSNEDTSKSEKEPKKADFMIPISFQSDMAHIHRRAGFTLGGN